MLSRFFVRFVVFPQVLCQVSLWALPVLFWRTTEFGGRGPDLPRQRLGTAKLNNTEPWRRMWNFVSSDSDPDCTSFRVGGATVGQGSAECHRSKSPCGTIELRKLETSGIQS